MVVDPPAFRIALDVTREKVEVQVPTGGPLDDPLQEGVLPAGVEPKLSAKDAQGSSFAEVETFA